MPIIVSSACRILVTMVVLFALSSGVVAQAVDLPASLTPKPGPSPRLTGAAVVGASPGKPVLLCVTAIGDKPMRFQATGLPAGLTLDEHSGQVAGVVAQSGDYRVEITASNAVGSAHRLMHIIIGADKLALTPPMGWNSWNCFAGEVTAKNVSDAADQFVETGLKDHGWQYINIDDFWMVKNKSDNQALHGVERDAQGRINSNSRFPDMKALADHIHSLGLKAGLYSSPGPRTCGGCVGSWGFEKQDATRFSEWGFDYLKYDWCSYGQPREGHTGDNWPDETTRNGYTLAFLKEPYIAMAEQLHSQQRDILFSLCQYGMGRVWEWGRSVGGNCWRITSDISDNWGSMSRNGFCQVHGEEAFAGPGSWNDPDMLVVGWVGWGPQLHASRLTPDEQYTHISLWCLLCAPLLIGCDLNRLDDFTLGLLTNDDVLEVDQDPKGAQAKRVNAIGDTQVWAKAMADGSQAVGLFNVAAQDAVVAVRWQDLGCSGPQHVRDLWRQKDLGSFANEYSATIPSHGCLLIRVSQ